MVSVDASPGKRSALCDIVPCTQKLRELLFIGYLYIYIYIYLYFFGILSHLWWTRSLSHTDNTNRSQSGHWQERRISIEIIPPWGGGHVVPQSTQFGRVIW